MDAAPSFVIVGHVTLDVVGNDFVVGGTATYAGLMAHNLGEAVGVVTSAPIDFDFERALPGIQVQNSPSRNTTTFENSYIDGRRVQYIRAVADPLDGSAIPVGWRGAQTALLAPLANEVGPNVESTFAGTFRAATPQGWLRRWGNDGLVRLEGWDGLLDRLSHLDAVILSEDDVKRDAATIDRLRRSIQRLVVTRGSRGSVLFDKGIAHEFAAFPTIEVDPTGAGDVFAAAFLVEFGRTGDAGHACTFANCAASFAVEAIGANGVPTIEQIRDRLRVNKRG